jgi:hypothetical protein
MDIITYITSNGWGLVVISLIVLGVVYLLMLPWGEKWVCPKCGDEFYSEAEAKGHQAIHGEHRPVREQ